MAYYRKTGWDAADVKCPFYVSDERKRKSISCEGFEAGSVTDTKFRTLDCKARHMGIYCTMKYENCPLFKTVYEQKYADDEK